jgi:hypothetical protein
MLHTDPDTVRTTVLPTPLPLPSLPLLVLPLFATHAHRLVASAHEAHDDSRRRQRVDLALEQDVQQAQAHR